MGFLKILGIPRSTEQFTASMAFRSSFFISLLLYFLAFAFVALNQPEIFAKFRLSGSLVAGSFLVLCLGIFIGCLIAAAKHNRRLHKT